MRAQSGTHQRGFTLVEVMVVVVIIGVLAAVAVPSYNKYITWSRAQEPLTLLPQIRLRQEMFFQDNNRYRNAALAPNQTNVKFNGDPQIWIQAATAQGVDQGWRDIAFQPPSQAVYFQYWVQRVDITGADATAGTPGTAAATAVAAPEVASGAPADVALNCGLRAIEISWLVNGESFVACARGALRGGDCGSGGNNCPMRFGVTGIVGRSKVIYSLN